uniref:Uncharacterized protein n=1 Tax=Strongyloides papillosus TaxID=174720 RepID=A0A0N5BQ25_STREA
MRSTRRNLDLSEEFRNLPLEDIFRNITLRASAEALSGERMDPPVVNRGLGLPVDNRNVGLPVDDLGIGANDDHRGDGALGGNGEFELPDDRGAGLPINNNGVLPVNNRVGALPMNGGIGGVLPVNGGLPVNNVNDVLVNDNGLNVNDNGNGGLPVNNENARLPDNNRVPNNLDLNELAAVIVRMLNEQNFVVQRPQAVRQPREQYIVRDDNRAVNDIPQRGFSDLKPEKFRKGMNFQVWYNEFRSYCRMSRIPEHSWVDALSLLLDHSIKIRVSNVPGLLDNFEELVLYLRRNYSGTICVQTAADELALLTNKRAKRFEELDEIGKKIDNLVEIKNAGMDKDGLLQAKIESLTKVIPAEYRSKFACGKDYTSFEQAVANAKRIWSLDSDAEYFRTKNTANRMNVHRISQILNRRSFAKG